MPDVKISDLPAATAAAADMQVEVIQGGGNFRLPLSALIVGAASADAAGVVELATQGETDLGQDAGRVVTPVTLAGRLATHRPVAPMGRREVAANATLAAADAGAVIDCTGTITLSFTVSQGWWAIIGNIGAGDITISASDGLTNWLMYPGERRLFYRGADALRSVVLRPFRRRFAVSGNFVKPPGYLLFGRDGGGAGGGGGSGARYGALLRRLGGTGGTGGGRLPPSLRYVLAASLAAVEPVVIGAGGAPGVAVTTDSTAGNAGSPGGATSFAGVSVPGGPGGGGGGGVAAVGVWVPSDLARGGGGGNAASGDNNQVGSGGIVAGQAGVASPGGGGGGGGGGSGAVAFGGEGAVGPGGPGGGTYEGGAADTMGGAGGAVGQAGSPGVGRRGGGGGGANNAAAGGKGGDGGPEGGGGGGGGGVSNGYSSGPGGKGGDGWFEIWGVV